MCLCEAVEVLSHSHFMKKRSNSSDEILNEELFTGSEFA